MPHVIVKLWPGKSEKQKTRLANEITKDVMNILHYGDGQNQFNTQALNVPGLPPVSSSLDLLFLLDRDAPRRLGCGDHFFRDFARDVVVV